MSSINNSYGILTVIKELPIKLIGKTRLRVVLFKCHCGSEFKAMLGNVVAGRTKSCGCTRFDKGTTHGESKTRLYYCWGDMVQRSRKRDNCHIYEPWKEFINFRDWAKCNGYSDSLELCRNGDVGDYEPGNCRWATHKENMGELGRSYVVTRPNGSTVDVVNLAKFCEDNELAASAMYAVASPATPGNKSHRGYSCTRILKNDYR